MKRSAALLILLVLGMLTTADAAEQPGEARIKRPEDYRRLELKLPDAIEGRDMTLQLGVHDGVALQAWGTIPDNRRLVAVYDAEKLRLSGDKLTGQVRLRVKLDELPQTYLCLLDVDARVSDGKVAGSFDSRYSVLTETLVYSTDDLRVEPGEASLFHYARELTGKVSRQVQARPSAQQAHLTLWTRHLMEGHASWQRYVVLEVDVSDGKVVDLKVAPRHGPRAEWSASNIEHDLAFDDKKLRGTVTFETKGNGGGTFGGLFSRDADRALPGEDLHDQQEGGAGRDVFASAGSRGGHRPIPLRVRRVQPG